MQIKGFLERALAELALEEVRDRRATLIQLFNRNLQTGMALATVESVAPPRHFREAQRLDAAAELALLAAINACSTALIDKTKFKSSDERRAIVQWSPAWLNYGSPAGYTAFQAMLHRLWSNQPFLYLAKEYLAGLNIDGQTSIVVDLSGSDMSFLSANRTQFLYSYLISSDLSHATLKESYLITPTLAAPISAELTFAAQGSVVLTSVALTSVALLD